jgi:hypothetical protein
MTPKERITEYFADTLSEAEECIKQAELTPHEVVEAFADALTEWHSYFQNSADIYEKLINAVISRYRNK